MQPRVLVTGISGWIAQHCAAKLLREGYRVRGSLRNMERSQEVSTALADFTQQEGQLSFCKLDLLEDQGWNEATSGCDYVMHVASPFPMAQPKDENELIRPAKEGTLRALKAAQKAGVKRVVVTSSVAAMFAHMREGVFSHESWSDLNSNIPNAYQRSKTIAEQAAWDFYHSQEGPHKIEMTVINPGAVLGPALSENLNGTSLGFGAAMLRGEMPAVPNVNIVMVDVRDVAEHHFKAMLLPDADGKRFISAHAKPDAFFRVAQILREAGHSKAPKRRLPSFLFKMIALVDSEARGMVNFIDVSVGCDNSLTMDLLEWTPTPLEKTVTDMGQSIKSLLNPRD